MARSTRQTIRSVGGRDLEAMRAEYNLLVEEVEELKTKFAAILAKLDLDAGVTDTNYGTTGALTATAAKKVTAK